MRYCPECGSVYPDDVKTCEVCKITLEDMEMPEDQLEMFGKTAEEMAGNVLTFLQKAYLAACSKVSKAQTALAKAEQDREVAGKTLIEQNNLVKAKTITIDLTDQKIKEFVDKLDPEDVELRGDGTEG